MARTIRRPGVKNVALSEMKDDLSRYLREAETQETGASSTARLRIAGLQ